MDKLIKEIMRLIEIGASIEDFDPIYKQLSQHTIFQAIPIENEWFYRVRPDEGKLIENISGMKYPPAEYATKGRLNSKGESLTYLASSELGTIAEMDLSLYEIYCSAKIKYKKKEIIFLIIGVKMDRLSAIDKNDNEILSLYRQLITTKDKTVYNSTIALAKHFMGSSKGFRPGILYSSVQEDKTNQHLYNIAVLPKDFDECFEFVEFEYNIIVYDYANRQYSIETLNRGQLQNNGSIKWELSYLEMLETSRKKYGSHIFKINNGIAHFDYGLGSIIDELQETYLVKFPKWEDQKEIIKSTVK